MEPAAWRSWLHQAARSGDGWGLLRGQGAPGAIGPLVPLCPNQWPAAPWESWLSCLWVGSGVRGHVAHEASWRALAWQCSCTAPETVFLLLWKWEGYS